MPIKVLQHKYLPEEMPQYWEQDGQGHKDAVSRESACIVVHCDLDYAKKMSAWFANEIFALPTCTHFDGATLSLYCGFISGMENRDNAAYKIRDYILSQ